MIIHSTTLRRLRLVTKAPAFVKSVAARSSDALRSSAASLSTCTPRSAPMIGATGFTVAEIAVGASELSLAGDVSEFQLLQ